MDVSGSRLIVVLYGLLALVVSLVAYVGYHRFVRDTMQVDLPAQVSEPAGEPARRPEGYIIPPPRRRDAVTQRVVAELKEMLSKRSLLLEEQSERLKQKTEAYVQLQEEADQYLRLLTDVLSQNSSIEGAEGEGAAATAVGTDESDADQQDALLLNVQAELAATRWELEQTQAQLAVLEISMLREMERTTEAATALINTGPAAVPALIVLLADQRPELRRWAATILGRMGPEAIDAVDDLLRALEDRDVEVRQAARAALEEIERRLD
jgi:hypothetical protein